jgi:hypothetical protein
MMRVLSCLFAAALFATPAGAATITLNFDTDFNGIAIANGTPINTAYPSADFTFEADDTILLGGGGVMSQPNFATGNGSNFFSPLQVTFSSGLGNAVSAFNVTNSSYTLSAYDSASNLLGTASCGSFPCSTTLTFPNQIAYARFTTQSQYGIDDLTLDYNAVPEPGSLFLLGSGAALLAASRARRRRG